MWLNKLRPRQDGRHFPGDIFKCISLNEDVWIFIKISLKFVPRVQLTILLWLRWLGTIQATSHYLNLWWLVYWWKNASLGLNEHFKHIIARFTVPAYGLVLVGAKTSGGTVIPIKTDSPLGTNKNISVKFFKTQVFYFWMKLKCNVP